MYSAEKHAELLTHYCLEAAANEYIYIQTTTLAEPLNRALYTSILKAGAYPVLALSYPEQRADFIENAADEVLNTLSPSLLLEAQMCAASTRIEAPYVPPAVDAARAQRLSRTHRPTATERMSKRWNVTLFPTATGAKNAGMTLPEYENFVGSAMFLNHIDPVAQWLALTKSQEEIITHLAKAQTMRIVAPQTDLSFSIAGRIWENSNGKHNMPSGEVFSAPVEESINGSIYYGLPTMYMGEEVSGIHLTFKAGKVVDAYAEKGNHVLQAALAVDEGARWVGEIGIGTNYGIQTPSKHILFDEKIGGTVHLALGAAYPQTGGKNQSSIHWDMICDLRQEGQIVLDGEVFQENGKFKL